MSIIAQQSIARLPLLKWTDNARYRFAPVFPESQQLTMAKQIAALKDDGARTMLLDLLEIATDGERYLAQAREEFSALHTVLVDLDTTLDEADARLAAKAERPSSQS